MTTDEATRLHLYEQARATWGADAADALMHALPRDPDRAATKDDLAVFGSELRTEMAELRGELAELRGEMRGEMQGMRGEMRGMRGEIVHRLFLGMVASNATLVGLVFAAVRLG